MCTVNSEAMALLGGLYDQNRAKLEPLGDALRVLVQISEEFSRRTGQEATPWDLWALMVRQAEPRSGGGSTATSI